MTPVSPARSAGRGAKAGASAARPHGLARVGWKAVALIATGLMAALTGCASLPPPVPRPDTHALASSDGTALHALVARAAPRAEVSGFHVIASGEEAYGVLVTLADQAERTLDLQYYLIRSDGSSRGVLQRVYAAAERGVRVRLLVDDLNTAGQDAGLMRLTQHPNITVLLYNPFPAGRMSTIARLASSLTDIARINQRMHNKMFVADNAVAVTGGRNLGDAYFLHSPKSNFLDLDVFVAGPAVRDLSATFDAFWNHPLAYPVAAIVQHRDEAATSTPQGETAFPQAAPAGTSVAEAPPTPAPDVQPADVPASAATAESMNLPPVPPQKRSPFVRDLQAGKLSLVWASSRVIADTPSKIESQGEPAPHETIADDVVSLMRSAREEVVLITPYFVPGERGVALMQELRDRGVVVKVLTNSLATTDAPAVHIGYARYREPLLKQGVELHELRRHIGAPPARIGSLGSSSASLHAKVVVVDRRTALVGSMNMDPRSARLNSEMGVVIRSPVIAQQLVRLYEDLSVTGYLVTLGTTGKLQWKSQPQAGAEGGEDTDHEPEAKLWLRIGLKLLSPFAPDEML